MLWIQKPGVIWLREKCTISLLKGLSFFRIKAISIGRRHLPGKNLLEECEMQTNTSIVRPEDNNSSNEVCSQHADLKIADRLFCKTVKTVDPSNSSADAIEKCARQTQLKSKCTLLIWLMSPNEGRLVQKRQQHQKQQKIVIFLFTLHALFLHKCYW